MDDSRTQKLLGFYALLALLLVCPMHLDAQVRTIPTEDNVSIQEQIGTQEQIETQVPTFPESYVPILGTQVPPSPDAYVPNLDWLEEEEYLYRAFFDLSGAAGGHRETGQGLLFIPLAQDEESLFFADIRGNVFDNSAWEGNFGLAFRHMIDDQWIAGAYGFFDVRRSQYNNMFNQGSVGFELLSIEWDFRVNGYVPDLRPERVNSLNRAFVSGNNVVVQAGEERAYWGTDFEVGRLLKTFDASPVDAEIRGYVGGYYFDNPAAGFQQMVGPRARVELRMFDLPHLGNGSRLVLAGQYQHDDVRGSQGTGMVMVRIPLPGNGDSQRLTRFQRRMVTPIIRDIDIIINQGHGPVEQAKLQSTGQVLQDITVIDANTVNAEQVFADAGTGSAVLFDGNAGVIDSFNGFVFNEGQLAIGGGKTYSVVGCNTGAVANVRFGVTPTVNVTNSDFDVFTLANNASMVGMNITGGRNGVAGNNLTGFTIARNNISGAAQEGVDLDGNINGIITNNTITMNGSPFLNEGVTIDNFTGGNITGNTFSNNRTGLEINGVMSGGIISNNIATGNDDFGYDIDILSGGQITNNSATANDGDGFRFRTVSGGEITNNTSSGSTSGDGFQVNGNITGGTISGNLAIGNDDDGFKFSGFDLSGLNFVNNTANGNGEYGFDFESPATISGGMIANNMANGNMESGFLFQGLITDGMISNNVANDNFDQGFDIRGTVSGGAISHNSATGNEDNGFVFHDITGGTISNNTATGNDRGFLFSDGTTFSGGTFIDNVSQDNRSNGYRFRSISGGTISNNRALNNGENGFALFGTIDGGTISNNQASNNADNGFFVLGFGVGNTSSFSDNEAINNTDAGYNVISGTPQTGVGTNTGSENGSNNSF